MSISYGPTPAVLSAQMDPPPIQPIVSMDFITKEYELWQSSVAFEDLINTDLEVGDDGIDIHIDYFDLDPQPLFPQATPTLLAEFQALLHRGFTVELEWDNLHSYNQGMDGPVLRLWPEDPAGPNSGGSYFVIDQSWAHANPATWWVYAWGGTEEDVNYRSHGDTPVGDQGRRILFDGTFGYDLGNGNYRSAVSINGTRVFPDSSYQGPSQRDIEYSLTAFLDPLWGISFFNEQDWWWSLEHIKWRSFKLYPPRPPSILHTLSNRILCPVSVTQFYTEVIHDLPGVNQYVPRSLVDVNLLAPTVEVFTTIIWVPSINVAVETKPPMLNVNLEVPNIAVSVTANAPTL